MSSILTNALNTAKEVASEAAGNLGVDVKVDASLSLKESEKAADERASKTASTSRKQETNKKQEKDEDSDFTLDMEIPGIKLPDIVNPKTNVCDPISAMSGVIQMISELPSFPQKMLKMFPGQLPVVKWTKKLNQMQKDIQSWISDLMSEQQELMQTQVDIDAKMPTSSADVLKKLNMSKKTLKKKESLIKKIINTLKAVIKAIVKIIEKIVQLTGVVTAFAISKITELCHIPPEWTEWMTEWLAGSLGKFTIGAVEPPMPNEKALAAWIAKNSMTGFYEAAVKKFKEVAKAVQTKIDEVNAITAHPRLASFSFAFWSDIPPEQLKSKSIASIVPDEMKGVVKDIVKQADDLEKDFQKTKKELRDAIKKTKSEVSKTTKEVKKELTSVI